MTELLADPEEREAQVEASRRRRRFRSSGVPMIPSLQAPVER